MNNYDRLQREADGWGNGPINWYPEYQAKCKELYDANEKIKQLSIHPTTQGEDVRKEVTDEDIWNEAKALYPIINVIDPANEYLNEAVIDLRSAYFNGRKVSLFLPSTDNKAHSTKEYFVELYLLAQEMTKDDFIQTCSTNKISGSLIQFEKKPEEKYSTQTQCSVHKLDFQKGCARCNFYANNGTVTEGKEEFSENDIKTHKSHCYQGEYPVCKYGYENCPAKPSEPSIIPVVTDGKDICEGCGKTFSWKNPPKDNNQKEPVVCSCQCYNKVTKKVLDYEKVGAEYCTEHGFNVNTGCDICLNIEAKELYPLWEERKDTEGEVNKEWYTFNQLTFAERNAYSIGRKNSTHDTAVVDYEKEAEEYYPYIFW